MTANEFSRLGKVKLTPGMPVEAFIQTGDRTMLSYRIKPLHDQLMHSFREGSMSYFQKTSLADQTFLTARAWKSPHRV